MPPRLVMIDDNIRDASGHYLELAQLLGDAASARGMKPIVATNQCFADLQTSEDLEIQPVFRTEGMLRWSLGASGLSNCQRDLSGKPFDTKTTLLFGERLKEILRPANRRPQWLFHNWKAAFIQLIESVDITEEDHIVVNTGDEFTLLAIASALRSRKDKRLNIHIIFHFSINDGSSSKGHERNQKMGSQIRTALEYLKHHHVRIHATTQELKADLDSLTQQGFFNPIPYPTRPCRFSDGFQNNPCKATLAGMPRAEKGKHFIEKFLADLAEHQLIDANRLQPSLQVSPRLEKSILSSSLISRENVDNIELIAQHLPTDQYHQWLDGTGIGIFLYDPTRYRTRCSGVLLEMMCRGIPVIVPDSCWLASQLNLAGGHKSVGYIYRSHHEIPLLLRDFLNDRASMVQRARNYATELREKHSAQTTLASMGI